MGESAAQLLAFSLLPISKVLVMCSLGLLMASPFVGVLSSSARKNLSKLVFSLFLPCLIFTQLGMAVTLEKILQWWFIPVNIVIASVIGCTIGYIVALIVRPPPQFFNLVVVMIGIGNIGNIPLVIIGAICRDQSNPFGDSAECSSNGVAYVSFGQWVGALIVYTFAYRMLAPPEISCDDIENAEHDKTSVKEKVLNTSAKTETSSPAAMFGNDDPAIPLLGNIRKNVKLMELLKSYWTGLRCQDIMQPPVVASFLALLFGSTPFLKNLIFDEQGALFFLSDSLNIMGAAMVPCIMLVLGGNLIGGAGSSQLGLRTTVAVTVTRLCMMPLLGLAVVSLADKYGFLPLTTNCCALCCSYNIRCPALSLQGL